MACRFPCEEKGKVEAVVSGKNIIVAGYYEEV